MKLSRREFVSMGLTGATGLCFDDYTVMSNAAETKARLPDEDGYKLWLRYGPPGDDANPYRRIVRQIRVDGASATRGIIRDELLLAATAMLGSTVSAWYHP
jgi:hypothetical protein